MEMERLQMVRVLLAKGDAGRYSFYDYDAMTDDELCVLFDQLRDAARSEEGSR